MMSIRTFVAAAVALSTLSCTPRVGIALNDDLTVTAPRYVTFFALEGTSSGSVAVDTRIKADITMALADHGLIEASPGEGQAVVVIHAASAAKESRAAFYAGWGGWHWQADGGATAHAMEQYTAGTLVVDVFDAWTKRLIWSGFAPGAVAGTETSHAASAEKAIEKMFANLSLPTVADDHTAAAADQQMRVIFSPAPALLIRVDGEPVYRAVGDTGLQRIVNTRSLILRDQFNMHYLRIGHRWMEAYLLTGTWSIAGMVPDGAQTVLRDVVDGDGVDLLDGVSTDGTANLAEGSGPILYVSTTPAELIVTTGEPRFAAVDGTALLRVTNTTGTVFRAPTDQELYVLASGRWYRAWTTQGPWQPVPSADLPDDLLLMTRRR